MARGRGRQAIRQHHRRASQAAHFLGQGGIGDDGGVGVAQRQAGQPGDRPVIVGIGGDGFVVSIHQHPVATQEGAGEQHQ